MRVLAPHKADSDREVKEDIQQKEKQQTRELVTSNQLANSAQSTCFCQNL